MSAEGLLLGVWLSLCSTCTLVQLLLSLIIVFNNLDYLRDVNENTEIQLKSLRAKYLNMIMQ